MAKAPRIEFTSETKGARNRVVLVGQGTDVGTATGDADGAARALKAAKFKGKLLQIVELFGTSDALDRLLIVGLGEVKERDANGLRRVGGTIGSRIAKVSGDVEIVTAGDALSIDQLNALAEGLRLASYTFDRYKTKKDDDEKADSELGTVFMVTSEADETLGHEAEAVVAGVNLSRDLTNEPANLLGPVEMAERAQKLTELGVEVEVLEPEAMRAPGHGRPARRRAGLRAPRPA